MTIPSAPSAAALAFLAATFATFGLMLRLLFFSFACAATRNKIQN
jgi:hypothetical protein